MKKNNFIEGAMIATIGIVLCKILGLIYVIPFYGIIGTKGGALYSYAYSIYSIFLSLSICGIPTAISKIVSEYNELENYSAKEACYKIASKLINIIGFISFVILIIFAPNIANAIIGDIEGGNTIEEVTIAIRIVSIALLVVPRLSVLRGYLQGHKFITPTSISNVIEQFIRVTIIIFGSYITVKILNLPIEYAVYIAIFSAFLSALFSYIYLKIKVKNNFSKDKNIDEKGIDKKSLLKQIIYFSLPFVLIDLLKSAYGTVDSLTVVKTLVNIGYDITTAETSLGVLVTWGNKLNMILVSISLGLTVSLVPNIAGSVAKKDFKDVEHKTNQSLKVLLFTILPMAFGISFLAPSVWNIFYGYSPLSVNIFRIYIIQIILFCLYTTVINLAQSMGETKLSLGTLIASFVLKAGLNIPMMYLFSYIGIDSYYGPIFTNVLAEGGAFVFILLVLKKKYKFSYKDTIKCIPKMLICLLAMLGGLSLLSLIVRIPDTNRILSIVNVAVYAGVGATIYFVMSKAFNLFDEILGHNFFDKITKKFKRKGKKI